MESSGREPTVLVVDDEEAVADAYSAQLRSEYDVRTAYGGEDALATIDEAVDVVLLDRRMPDISGDEVLERIRERSLGCQVVMVTAVDPDFDIVEMPFEEYLQKPASKAELVEAIDRQVTVTEYDERFAEFVEVTSKVTLLEEEKSTRELEQSDELQQLRDRAQELRHDLDQTVGEFEDSKTAFQNLL